LPQLLGWERKRIVREKLGSKLTIRIRRESAVKEGGKIISGAER